MKKQVLFLLALLVLISCSKKSIEPEENETETGTVRDIEGNVYQIIRIGNQWWMAENLKVTKYRNGEWIINVTGSKSWSENLSTGAFCYYDNDYNNAKIYGNLYNWYAVHDSRNIAPAGWHVPTDDEWQTLVDYLGGDTIAGGKMKSAGTIQDSDSLWHEPNEGATNESGFSALPGGGRVNNGAFDYKGYNGFWWSSTEYSSTNVWDRKLDSNIPYVSRNKGNKQGGRSIRCIRD